MIKILIICGPTGIGKTSFSLSAAETFNGEIVGADSMQIYQHMEIGTAKPDADERERVPHHLVDFVDPKTNYDAGRYMRDADKAIQEIHGRGRLPIVVGGTGLYIRSLMHGLFRTRAADADRLEQLNRELEVAGAPALHQRLMKCDPSSAGHIHPNDGFRIIRALEVFETTGTPISEFQADHGFSHTRYQALKIGLTMERESLYNRINARVEQMLNAGLLKETTRLMEMGYSPDLKSMQCIGYRQMGMFIRGEVSWDEAVRLLKRDTRRYAKRQYTWFNRDDEIHWFEPDRFEAARGLIKEFLT